MDPLEALGDDEADAQQRRPLGRPVARRARAVLATGEDAEGRAFGRVAHRDVVDESLVTVGQVDRIRPLLVVDEPVAQPDVGERAARHHLVVTTSRAIRVELQRADAVRLQPLAGRRPRRDRAGRRDVVGRDRVAEDSEDAGLEDVGDRPRFERETVEERRLGDVRRVRLPDIAIAGRDRQRAPAVVALEDGRIGPDEERRIDRVGDDRADLVGLRPDVGEEDRPAVAAGAERFGREVDVDPAGEREGDHERG